MHSKKSTHKQMTLQEAINTYVEDGTSVTFGGFIGRDSVAAAREIIRQGKKDLTIIDDSKTDVMDLLLGAGCVARWEGAYLGYGAIGLGQNIRRAIEKKEPRPVDFEDWSNAGMSMRFLAGALNIPFIPYKSMLGTDIAAYNEKIKIIDDPYGGEQVALLPAAHPEIAIIHVHKADAMGNAQIMGFIGNDENKARVARHTIITCEEIVSTEEIRQDGNFTVIPFYCVDAVVHLPFGVHPQSCYGSYAYDVLFCSEYYEKTRTREGFLEWLDDYVYNCEDHIEYCNRVGWDRLHKLRYLERQFNRTK